VAGYLKTTCGVQQMVSNGNEGYRVQGAYDPYASTAYPFNVRRPSVVNHTALGSIVGPAIRCVWGAYMWTISMILELRPTALGRHEIPMAIKIVCHVRTQTFLLCNASVLARAPGAFDCQHSRRAAQNFIQDGTKGEDFNRNLYNSHLDFATIHVYPQVLLTVVSKPSAKLSACRRFRRGSSHGKARSPFIDHSRISAAEPGHPRICVRLGGRPLHRLASGAQLS